MAKKLFALKHNPNIMIEGEPKKIKKIISLNKLLVAKQSKQIDSLFKFNFFLTKTEKRNRKVSFL